MIFAVTYIIINIYVLSIKGYPHVISHRGASGYVPEHSTAAYQLAIDLLGDYIEPDLCLSKDGIFVAMHDILLDDTTNVASISEFQDRISTKIVDGKNMTGYFVSDFLYSELEILRLNQRLTGRTSIYNGLFQIPSLDVIFDLIATSFNSTGRLTGMYTELKHPSFFHSLGFDMEDMFLSKLTEYGFDISGPTVPNNLTQVLPIIIQCFEKDTLVYLSTKTNIPLVQLLETQLSSYWSSANMKEISLYAQAIGPTKSDFGDISYEKAMKQINIIRNYNLYIHPWTFRADSGILLKFHGNFYLEQMYFLCCLGMDGLFTEFPDRTRETINIIKNTSTTSMTTTTTSSNSNQVIYSNMQCDMPCSMY